MTFVKTLATALLEVSCTAPSTYAVARSAAAQPFTDNNPAIAVYAQNGASVVNITSIAVVPTRQGQLTQPQGIGSGFMLDMDGGRARHPGRTPTHRLAAGRPVS